MAEGSLRDPGVSEKKTVEGQQGIGGDHQEDMIASWPSG